jgi:hypothetical protein
MPVQLRAADDRAGELVADRSQPAFTCDRRRTDVDQRDEQGYPKLMTREQAIAEVERRRASGPGGTWIATEHGDEWTVARIALAQTKVTGTATKPPPAAPRDDPHSAIERAAWFAAGG